MADSRQLLCSGLRALFRPWFRGSGARLGRARAAALFEAAAQALHQIHDFGLAWLGDLLEVHLLAFQLGLDDFEQVLAVLIGVLRRIPLRREAVDQRIRTVPAGPGD